MQEQQASIIDRGLVVDASFSSRRQLIHDLRSTGIASDVIEAPSVRDGMDILVSKIFDLCLIGPTLSENSAIDLIKHGKEISAERKCAFVAIVNQTGTSAPKLLDAGADGAIERPYTTNTFSQIVREAVQVAKASAQTVYQAPYVERPTAVPRPLKIEALPNLSSVIFNAAQGLRGIARDITCGKLKLTSSGDPTLVTREAIRKVFESALCLENYQAQLPGTFEYFFVSSLVDWFTERIHRSERASTDHLRRKLLSFK